jgi:putative toxin-antitoxin system antitoxin component (TIGR02293 family)
MKKISKVKEPGQSPAARAGVGAKPYPEAEASPSMLSVLREPEAEYGTAEIPVAELSAFQKMNMSDRGITKKELEKFRERAGLSYDQLAAMLHVTRVTLTSKAGVSRFNPSISEKIISIWEIYAYGYAVFSSESLFREWLFRKNQMLGGIRPFDLLPNSFGREELRTQLGRLEYGVYA